MCQDADAIEIKCSVSSSEVLLFFIFSASVMELAERLTMRADGRSCYCITRCGFGGLKFPFSAPAVCISVKSLTLLKRESVSLLNRSFRECLCKPGQIVPPITRFQGVSVAWSELNKLQNICSSGKGRINAAGTAPQPNGPAHTRTLDFLTDKMEQLTTGLKEERRHHCFLLYFTRPGSNNRHYCKLTFDEMALGAVKQQIKKGNQEEKYKGRAESGVSTSIFNSPMRPKYTFLFFFINGVENIGEKNRKSG